jgi:hypothetical protein
MCLPVTKSIPINELCQLVCVSLCLYVNPCYSVFKYIAVISAVNFKNAVRLPSKELFFIGGQNCSRNFPKSLTPPFLCVVPLAPMLKYIPTKHGAPPPAYRNLYPQYKYRGKLLVLRPPQGRATHKPSVLRRRYNGGLLLSLPLAARLPPLKINRRGLLSPVATLLPVANPSFYGSKGEEQPPPRGRGPQSKKNTGVHAGVFFYRSASCLPRRCTAAAGRTLPARFPGFPSRFA